MAEVKVLHDREGQTLTVWFTDPSLEYVAEETGDEPDPDEPDPKSALDELAEELFREYHSDYPPKPER